ncbi:hypothetical protein NPIL_646261 [Nephila pilipes]|uniref:Uncharacterized protein n=1 Tax=Nephila pilipes TaxID=299642 RepID=A0A8X6MLU5_NEPPI|nr:hypothetical protein NPIL_646261 [Nephila pilipes]
MTSQSQLIGRPVTLFSSHHDDASSVSTPRLPTGESLLTHRLSPFLRRRHAHLKFLGLLDIGAAAPEAEEVKTISRATSLFGGHLFHGFQFLTFLKNYHLAFEKRKRNFMPLNFVVERVVT